MTGCTKISDGCKHCYAERMATRLQAMGVEKYRNGFDLTVHESALDAPLRWKKPRLVFVNSMSDLFHESVPAVIHRVGVPRHEPERHSTRFRCSRSARPASRNSTPGLIWTPNIWLGTSIESKEWLDRLAKLKESNALTKFLSLEPLLGPLPSLDLAGIDWVIVGGESGPGARPMKADWVREIRDNCLRSHVPFFFKQWGGVFKKQTGRILDKKTWDQLPDFKTI